MRSVPKIVRLNIPYRESTSVYMREKGSIPICPSAFTWIISVFAVYLLTNAKSMKPTWRDWTKSKLKNQDIVDIRRADIIFDLITVDIWIYPHWPVATLGHWLMYLWELRLYVPLKVVLKNLAWNYITDCNHKSTWYGAALQNSLGVSPWAYPKNDKERIKSQSWC